MNEKEWYTQLHWKKNPFTLEIYPSLLVGYSKEISLISSYIDEGQKYILITGATGSGKTTLLKYLQERHDAIYLPKPPTNQKELLSVIQTNLLRRSILDILLRRKEPTLYNIQEEINRRYKNKRIIILVDEVHETNVNVLEWFRTLVDQIEGTTLVMAGLPIMKEEHLRKLETLSQRITLDVELESLTKDEVVELIQKRIHHVGGKSIEPFTIDSFNDIYEKTGGFPREVIKLCNDLIHEAIKRKFTFIDSSYFDKKQTINGAKEIKTVLQELTEKQRKMIALLEEEPFSPSQIVKKINLEEYSSKSHALRATNNILKRLVNNKLITRERRGRSYVYSLSPKLKNILIKA